MLLGADEAGGLFQWMWANKEWFFSGAGVLMLGWISGLGNWIVRAIRTRALAQPISAQLGHISTPSIDDLKGSIQILFIDDDTAFRVVEILQAAGWLNTKIVTDIGSLDEPTLRASDVVFVDIQGVGKTMQFRDEGLGLTAAIKDRYPNKFVVVYSAETRGNRFHHGLKAADDFLPKNAEPYEFQRIVEDFAKKRAQP